MRRISPLILLLMAQLSLWAQQPSPQSKKVTEKFFPDPEVEITTPAFDKKRGYTTYNEMLAFLDQRLKAHPELTSLSFIGKSQKGKAIPLFKVKKKDANPSIKVWIQGGLHGNEMGSTEGVLYILDQLLNNKYYSYLLDRLEVAFLPMANIDGYERKYRDAINGLDLNRDQTKLNIPESIVLKEAFNAYQPHVALDFHEYRPYRRDFARLSTYGITNIYDVMFLYSGNPNVPQSLREYTKETFVANAEKVLDENELRHHDYFSSTEHLGAIQLNQGSHNARSSATSFALANTISTLIEVRGVAIGKTSFKRRVQSVLLVGMSYLKTAYEEADQIKAVLKQSAEDRSEAVAELKRNVYRDKVQVIDLDKNEEMTLDITIRDAWNAIPVISRPRPEAYIILPTEKAIISRLKTLGLRLDSLEQAGNMEVQAYKVIDYKEVKEKYEGVKVQEVKTELHTEGKSFPAGTIIVPMDQERANLAIEVLEPEAKNSFVSWHVVPTEQGETLPIYRYLKK